VYSPKATKSALNLVLIVISLGLGVVCLVTWFQGAFHAGMAALAASLYFGVLSWTPLSDRVRLFFSSFLQTLLNLSLVLWLLILAMGATFTGGDSPLVVDFLPLCSAGLIAVEAPGDLYDPEVQFETERRASGLDLGPQNFLPFAYPPVSALIFVPLTIVPFLPAYYVFTFLNLLAMSFGVFVVSGRLKLSRDQVRMVVLFVTAFFPVYFGLVEGQTSFVAFLLAVFFFLDLGNERHTRAGLWAGLLCFKPQVAVLPLLSIVFLSLPGSVVAIAIAAAQVGLSYLLVGSHGLTQLLGMIQSMGVGAEPTANPLNMYNLRAIGEYLGISSWLWILIGSLITLTTIWLVWRKRSAWTLAAATLAIILVSPHSNPHDAVLAVLAVSLVVSVGPASVSLGRMLLLLVLSLIPLFSLSLWVWAEVRVPIVPVALLVLFVTFAMRVFSPAVNLHARED
jgi:hypothetical protein